jgi:carbon-monoxide dehydrogenase small subunit
VSEEVSYVLRVNGVVREVEDAWMGESLLAVLRDRLGLPGSKNACEQGECGSCSVLVDGVLVCSCLVLAASAVDSTITSVEGLADDGRLTDVQEAFLEAGAVQCGFCTPGLIVAVHDLLDRRDGAGADRAASELDVREALAGNLCRCTGYGRILEAVESVAARRADARRASGSGIGGRDRG